MVLTDGVTASLLGSLSYVGVVTGPVVAGQGLALPGPITPILPILPFTTSTPTSPWSQLEADWKTLQTELQSLAAKSGVTIADLENLTNDSQAIAGDGFHFDLETLNPVISELATAVAGAMPTTQAQTDFAALFPASSVSMATINTTFSDLVKTITDSGVTTTDLTTVATDEAAIQTDLSNLPKRFMPGSQTWLDQQGAVPTALVVSQPAAVTGPTAAVSQPGGLLPSIIISPFGSSSLLGSLSYTGIVTSPVVAGTQSSSSSTSPVSQLKSDVQKLEAELVTLAEKSSLTVADLQNLTTDGQAINQAGFHFDVQTLLPVISELATAVAGNSPTTQAQTDFTSLFGSSSVLTATITTTFNDLVKAIQDSNVTTGDLTTVASDQAAIQADLKKLAPVLPITPPVPIIPVLPILPGSGSGSTGTGSTGTGSTGTGSTGIGSTGTGSTGTGSTGGTTTTGHHHKLARVRIKEALVHTVKKAVNHAVKTAHTVALAREKKALRNRPPFRS